MKLLDLSKMSRVATDGDTSTFRHEDGHEIRILHRALPRIQQEQIKRIAIKEQKLAKGGEVRKMYSDSEEPVSKDDGAPLAVEPASQNDPDFQAPPNAGPMSHNQPITINVGAPPAAAPPAPAPQAAPPPAPAKPLPPVPASVQALSPPPGVQDDSQPSSPDPLAASNTSAPPNAAPAGGNFNDAAIAANQGAVQGQEAANTEVQNSANALRTTLKEFDDYQKRNPINPTRWASSLGEQGKADLAIGLGLMGFGGTANAGFDFINKQIQNDISAQQQNLENKKSVFSGYKEMFGDDVAAANMTRATMNDIFTHKVNMAALAQGSSQAMQNAQAFSTQKKQENEQLVQNTAKILQNANKSAPEAPKDQLFVPGYKNALFALKANPIAEKDYPHVMEEVTQAEQAQKAIDEVNKVFPLLAKNATIQGRVARGGSGALSTVLGGAGELLGGHGAAAIGAGAGAATKSLGNVGNSQNKQYEAQKEQLVKTIGNLLPQFGPTAVNEAADKFTPEQGDTPKDIEVKRQGFIDLIKNSVKHTYTDNYPGIIKPE